MVIHKRFLYGIVASEELVDSNREEPCDRQNKSEIGIGIAPFPFRDGLHTYVKMVCKLSLCHTASESKPFDVGSEWDLQSYTSCENIVCRTQEKYGRDAPIGRTPTIART